MQNATQAHSHPNHPNERVRGIRLRVGDRLRASDMYTANCGWHQCGEGLKGAEISAGVRAVFVRPK